MLKGWHSAVGSLQPPPEVHGTAQPRLPLASWTHSPPVPQLRLRVQAAHTRLEPEDPEEPVDPDEPQMSLAGKQ